MVYSEETLRGLKQAYYKYNRQIGKMNKRDALILLRLLDLTTEANDLVADVIEKTFAANAPLSTFLRLEAIPNGIQILAMSSGGPRW